MHPADQQEIDSLRSSLRINKHRLDDHLETSAETMERIGHKVSAMDATEAERKDHLAKTEARLTEEYHREGERVTKDRVEAKVRRHPERVSAWESYQGAARDAAEWKHLLDAWKARAKDLQALGHLFGDQYFALTSIGLDPKVMRQGLVARPSRSDRKDYSAAGAREPMED